ncbi:stage II sporulation protein D [Proteinivorax tanatarense]|uniref:Stage II sporulation protein D n=1 Tax=Proteinivorax tanatarense TaxID=1260629 RepID=A0AAU7VL25_9FIRM
MGKHAMFFIIALLIIIIIMPAILVKGCKFVTPYELDVKLEDDTLISVFFHEEKEIKEMRLEDYLLGVVAGEMPASFDIEALKAQAVVARTYAYNQIINGGCTSHPDADICTNYQSCQHWISQKQAKAKWSTSEKSSNWDKIIKSVEETKGKILTFEGQPVNALYHSTCGGNTENSEDVFQSSKPYLKSVECDYCSDSSRLEQKVKVSEDDFLKMIQDLVKVQNLNYEKDIAIDQRSSTNRVKDFRIKDETYSGNDVRMAVGLNSTNFEMSYDESDIIFEVLGYGHGVGLCQYGANGMAKLQKNFADILHFYYKDVEIKQIYEKVE